MVDTKKEQERDELHRAIWAIADELRGAVDGWDFKNYVLGTMFYRYISENLCNYINSGEIEAGNIEFDLRKRKSNTKKIHNPRYRKILHISMIAVHRRGKTFPDGQK